MNLTKQLRAYVIEQFKAGQTVDEIARWYRKPVWKIEDVIRDALNRDGTSELASPLQKKVD